jgi:hypothetical protein
MTADVVLTILLVVSVILGALVALLGMAALGRKVADLELLIERDVGGVPRIQSLINIRSQSRDVLLGVFFVFINSLLLAGAPAEWRTWSFRVLWTVLLAGILWAKIEDWLAEREQVRLLMGEQSSAVTSYRQMANDAVSKLEIAAARDRATRGDAPYVPLAPVVPEHNSPVSPGQQEAADVQTMRARLVAASLDLGFAAEAVEADSEGQPS